MKIGSVPKICSLDRCSILVQSFYKGPQEEQTAGYWLEVVALWPHTLVASSTSRKTPTYPDPLTTPESRHTRRHVLTGTHLRWGTALSSTRYVLCLQDPDRFQTLGYKQRAPERTPWSSELTGCSRWGTALLSTRYLRSCRAATRRAVWTAATGPVISTSRSSGRAYNPMSPARGEDGMVSEAV